MTDTVRELQHLLQGLPVPESVAEAVDTEDGEGVDTGDRGGEGEGEGVGTVDEEGEGKGEGIGDSEGEGEGEDEAAPAEHCQYLHGARQHICTDHI